ncbi:MAG: 23S rRNA (uracil(1939)-C(5))-methyltransferase RlmD [Lachnospiraceae bacterium]|nr:23S rRNA (uracil(1939)-C(5))-methyltransferase RlmD [Lachnospiraceae bacterium]
MKKGEIYEGVVREVRFGNKGIVETKEGVITVKNVLPGQVLSVQINKARHGSYEGRVLEVIKESPLIKGEVCPHFGSCGGCVYQPVPYEEQLKIKENQIRDLMSEVEGDYEFLSIAPSPVTANYRNKMEFSFGDEYKDGPLALGFHKRASTYDVITPDMCYLVHPDILKVLHAVLDYFAQREVPYYHKFSHDGILRHLLIRRSEATGELLVCLVATSQLSEELVTGYKDAVLSQSICLKGNIAGILHTVNDSLSDAVIDQGTTLLYGKDHITEKLLDLEFKISPFSFFQTNSKGAERLYSVARDFIGSTKDKVVFDLYSGTGTIAQIVAPVAKKVIGVEIIPEAVDCARANALANGLTNCEFIAGDVLKVIDDIKDKPDLIILDPPRDGIHPKALPKIIAYGVDKYLYISCKPTSLVRDLKVFLENGYEVEKVQPVDMFPGTGHVETVVLLSRKQGQGTGKGLK